VNHAVLACFALAAVVRAQPEHELTSAFLEKHMVTAEMPQRVGGLLTGMRAPDLLD
jgi:hypothetical protein